MKPKFRIYFGLYTANDFYAIGLYPINDLAFEFISKFKRIKSFDFFTKKSIVIYYK